MALHAFPDMCNTNTHPRARIGMWVSVCMLLLLLLLLLLASIWLPVDYIQFQWSGIHVTNKPITYHQNQTIACEHVQLQPQPNYNNVTSPTGMMCLSSRRILSFLSSPSLSSPYERGAPIGVENVDDLPDYIHRYIPSYHTINNNKTNTHTKPCTRYQYEFHGYLSGFFSYLNNALNMAVHAYMDPASCPYRPVEFMIFPSFAHRPMYEMLHPDRRDFIMQLYPSEDPGSIPVPSDVSPVRFSHLDRSAEWSRLARKIAPTHEIDMLSLFQMKQRLAQFMWQLEPQLETLVQALMKHMHESDVAHLPSQLEPTIAVHIRRQDKKEENQPIPVEKYVSACLSILTDPSISFDSQVFHIFVMSDDDSAIDEFKKLIVDTKKQLSIQVHTVDSMWSSFHTFMNTSSSPTIANVTSKHPCVINLYESYVQQHIKTIRWYNESIITPVRVHTSSLQNLNDDQKQAVTLRLMIESTIASRSTYFIATFSSNVGRGISLLHGNPMPTVGNNDRRDIVGEADRNDWAQIKFKYIQSLDQQWHPFHHIKPHHTT